MNKINNIFLATMMFIVVVSNANAVPLLPYEWKNFNGGVTWVINPTNSGLTSSQVGSAIMSSMQAWDTQSPYYNLFSGYTTNYNQQYVVYDGINSIVWQPMGINGAPASSQTYADNTGKIIETDIKFNSDLPWSTNGITGFDVQGVGTHEIGHAIGIADDYSCPLCTMFYTGLTGLTARTLEQGDIDAVKIQYCSGDVNGDRIVDIYDASKVTLAWDSTPGMPNYNIHADINGDGIVDIYDASKVTYYWGNTC